MDASTSVLLAREHPDGLGRRDRPRRTGPRRSCVPQPERHAGLVALALSGASKLARDLVRQEVVVAVKVKVNASVEPDRQLNGGQFIDRERDAVESTPSFDGLID